MEDRNRRCNIRFIGLDEGLGAPTHFISQSLPKWFPTLGGTQIEIMSARKMYSTGVAVRALTSSVLRSSSRQTILRAAKRAPLSINSRKIRFLLYPVTLKIEDGAQF